MLSLRNSFGVGPHFCQQNKHISLKKMIIRTTCKAVDCFSNVARVNYLIVTSHLHLHIHLFFITLVKSMQTSHQSNRAQSEKTLRRLSLCSLHVVPILYPVCIFY